MKLTITRQESFSRGELILRTLFGFLYIDLPHIFCLMFVGIWSSILTFISWWSILFTGRYPQSFFEFQVGMYRWNVRWMARFYNLADGYPAFGINATDDHTNFEMAYPESLSRGTLLLKTFFGALYVIFPHMFVLIFASLWGAIQRFIAWWVVLFTGSYPESMYEFNVGLIRWTMRINLYMGFMSDDYPPFSGKPDADDGTSAAAPPAPDSTPVAEAPATPPPPPDPTPAPDPTPEEPGNSGDDGNSGSSDDSGDDASEEEKPV